MGGVVMKSFNLDEYSKNPNRKIITRDGKNVKIIGTDVKGKYPIVAAVEIENENGFTEEVVKSYTKDGRYLKGETNEKDLFFAVKKHEGWVNIYVDSENNMYTGAWIHKSKDDAEKTGKDGPGYITTIKIEWEK